MGDEDKIKALFSDFSKPEKKKSEPKKEEAKQPEPNKPKVEIKVEPLVKPKEEVIKPKEEVPFVRTATPVAMKKEEEFDLSPMKSLGKHVLMIYGLKGGGKTTLAFSMPTTNTTLSFDRKSVSIQEQSQNPGYYTVLDGSRYMDKTSPEAWLESADKTWRYLNKLLDNIPNDKKPDWVVVDGGEIFESIAEMTMRYRNNIMPFQGIQNKNIWKERRMYIDQMLRKCIEKSNKGVIWTSYIDKDEIVKDGDFVAKADIPRWIDAVLYEVDVVIKVERETTKAGQLFYATVESSKWPKIPEGPRRDVTGKGMSVLIKGEI